VEDSERLGWLRHYIHLNPARAGIGDARGLRAYRYSSCYRLWDKRRRPKELSLAVSLECAGQLKDTSAGRRKYAQHLEWLAEDEPRQKAFLFDGMSKGWALGARDFKKALLEDGKALRACLELGVDEAREMRDTGLGVEAERCLEALGKDRSDVEGDMKSANWKIAVASHLKKTLLSRNGWLADRLGMGTESAVARYCSEFFRGETSRAATGYQTLITKVLD